MARKIEIDLTADTRAFERSMDSAGNATERFEKDLKSAESTSSKFDSALDTTTSKLGSTTNGMRSTADLAGGLGDVLGIQAAGPIAGYAMGFADIADGLGGLLAPALTKAKAAFLAMNTTLLANPIFLVVAALAALTIGFVIAYKKSETFRKIVHAAMDGVKRAVSSTVNWIVDAVTGAAKVLAKVADIITTPYQIAFRAIARLWNNTIGKLEVSIPGFSIPFGPSFGGISFGVPDIPMLAKGGPAAAGRPYIVGERGPELFVPKMSGTVLPNGAGGAQRIEIVLSGDAELVALMRRSIRSRGGNVQTVIGTT